MPSGLRQQAKRIVLELPCVTLVIAETRARELARLAALHTLERIRFGEVIIHTDNPASLAIPDARYIKIPNWDSESFNNYVCFDAFETVRTPYAMFLEYDGGICDVSLWRDEFLGYDWIGAPWPWWGDENTRVGNGGFSIRTKRLADFISRNRETIPANTDNKICRDFRPELEKHGFRWAPQDVAWDFSVEQPKDDGTFRHFGFHRTLLWPRVLEQDDLTQRLAVMAQLPDDGPHYYREQLFKTISKG